eukprot:4971700-Amphidinium_carterae.1
MCEIPSYTDVTGMSCATAGSLYLSQAATKIALSFHSTQHPSSALIRCRIRNSPNSMVPVLERCSVGFADLLRLIASVLWNEQVNSSVCHTLALQHLWCDG